MAITDGSILAALLEHERRLTLTEVGLGGQAAQLQLHEQKLGVLDRIETARRSEAEAKAASEALAAKDQEIADLKQQVTALEQRLVSQRLTAVAADVGGKAR